MKTNHVFKESDIIIGMFFYKRNGQELRVESIIENNVRLSNGYWFTKEDFVDLVNNKTFSLNRSTD